MNVLISMPFSFLLYCLYQNKKQVNGRQPITVTLYTLHQPPEVSLDFFHMDFRDLQFHRFAVMNGRIKSKVDERHLQLRTPGVTMDGYGWLWIDDLNTISSIASVSVYICVLRVLAQENICRCIFSNHGSGALGWATLMGNCCVRRQSEIRVVVVEWANWRRLVVKLWKVRFLQRLWGHLGHYLRDLPLSQRTRNELKRIHRD